MQSRRSAFDPQELHDGYGHRLVGLTFATFRSSKSEKQIRLTRRVCIRLDVPLAIAKSPSMVDGRVLVRLERRRGPRTGRSFRRGRSCRSRITINSIADPDHLKPTIVYAAGPARGARKRLGATQRSPHRLHGLAKRRRVARISYSRNRPTERGRATPTRPSRQVGRSRSSTADAGGAERIPCPLQNFLTPYDALSRRHAKTDTGSRS